MSDDVRSERVATSAEPEWIDPLVHPAPMGSSVWLLNEGGVAVRGQWRDDGGFVAWCPFPKMPVWLKRRLAAHELRNSPIRDELMAKSHESEPTGSVQCHGLPMSETDESLPSSMGNL